MTVTFRDRHDYTELKVVDVLRCEFEIITRGKPFRFWAVTKNSGEVVRFDKMRYNILSVAD